MPKPEEASGGRDRWTTLMTTADRHEAEFIVGMLRANDVPAIVFDQGSTAYPLILNDVSVMVHRDHLVKARFILENQGDA
ncbi:MAG: DUF2007 domain-containing protein [Flavobacteriales bacterium]|nr:DUF2007 domain-containing protein [Flavobacteriales bacterium]MCB9166066.1 DUF2007 domain-containing protein [Flavobacteriales bacterium]